MEDPVLERSDLDAPPIRDRWYAAACYLCIIVFIPIFVKDKSAFLARHCRQGFALFFAEVVAILLLAAVESTLGRIPILGIIVSVLLGLALFLAFLLVSVIGFVKALSGEEWSVPGLDELANKVPIN